MVFINEVIIECKSCAAKKKVCVQLSEVHGKNLKPSFKS